MDEKSLPKFIGNPGFSESWNARESVPNNACEISDPNAAGQKTWEKPLWSLLAYTVESALACLVESVYQGF